MMNSVADFFAAGRETFLRGAANDCQKWDSVANRECNGDERSMDTAEETVAVDFIG
jgi:hypothetical protein